MKNWFDNLAVTIKLLLSAIVISFSMFVVSALAYHAILPTGIIIFSIVGLVFGFVSLIVIGNSVTKKQDWYEALLDSVKFPISVTDLEGRWTFVNKPVEDLLKKTRKQLYGRKCHEWGANICKTENCGIEKLRKGKLLSFFEQFGGYFKVDTSYLTDKKGNNIGHIEFVADYTDLYKQSQLLKEATNKLLEITQKNTTSSSELHSSANSAATAAEQISANTGVVSAAAEEMTASIEEISSSTQEAHKVSNAIAKKSELAVSIMENLSKNSTEISNIIQVITGIAEQTNLLALNATIEAARAGEVGKGFAVVANEVKGLALESSKSAESIKVNIEKSVSDTNSAVAAIKEIAQIANQINEITSGIAAAIEEQSVTMNEVSKNIGEVSVGSTLIAEINNSVSQEAQHLAEASSNLQALMENIKSTSDKLEEQLTA